ncbi:MAG: hypothetical protein GC201_01085 [Alphaproteobacteria bacterium]|nr:hypothetical protein [Alphaproteobacteria bacterium]
MNLPIAQAPIQALPEAEKHRAELFPYDGRHPPLAANQRLIPRPECERIEAWLARSLEPAREDDAMELAALLVGGFTRQQVNDPDAFLWHLRAAFSRHPADIGYEVAQAIPATLRWLDVATVNEALDERSNRRKLALIRVREHLAEHDRRDQSRSEP